MKTQKPKGKSPKQPDGGSLASLHREMGGGPGLNLYLRATIVCQSPVNARGRACCASDEFSELIEPVIGYSSARLYTEFMSEAMDHFTEKGWRIPKRVDVVVLRPTCRRTRRARGI